MSREILGIITAKAQSSGLPGKNNRLFLGKPLFAWTVNAAKRSKLITKTVVSSDSQEILKISRSLGADAIERPSHLAAAESSSESVVSHVLNVLEASQSYTPQSIVLLQPTSPLRDSNDIDRAVILYQKANATALISGFEPQKNPLKDFIITKDGYLENLAGPEINISRRQDLPRVFRPNGAIFLVDSVHYKQTESFTSERCIPFFMDFNRSIDIDTHDDFVKAEALMQQTHQHQ